jgi:hypothetical protein
MVGCGGNPSRKFTSPSGKCKPKPYCSVVARILKKYTAVLFSADFFHMCAPVINNLSKNVNNNVISDFCCGVYQILTLLKFYTV